VVVAADLVWYGGLGSLSSYREQGASSSLITAIVYFTAAAVAFFGGIAAVGFVARSADFLIEVESEMVKVTWPTRPEVVRATVMISVMTVILAVLIFVIDILNKKIVYDGLFSLGSGA
jgi:preprotein translocase SecE subunit